MNRMLKEKTAAHICSGNNGMTEGFKEFLTYGTEQKITKKQVMETYIILLLLGVVSNIFVNSMICTVITVGVLSAAVVFTIPEEIVTGEKIFLMNGMIGIAFSWIFTLLGTGMILSIMNKQEVFRYVITTILIYCLFMVIYGLIVIYFIRKRAYKEVKKSSARIPVMLLAVCGISVGRMLTNGLTYETLMKIGGVCFYFLAIVFLLGILNLIKYFYCRKYLGGI